MCVEREIETTVGLEKKCENEPLRFGDQERYTRTDQNISDKH